MRTYRGFVAPALLAAALAACGLQGGVEVSLPEPERGLDALGGQPRRPAVTFAVWGEPTLPPAVARAARRVEGVRAAGIAGTATLRARLRGRAVRLTALVIDPEPLLHDPAFATVGVVLAQGHVAVNAHAARVRRIRVDDSLEVGAARVAVRATLPSDRLFGYQVVVARWRARQVGLAPRARALVVAVDPGSVNEATKALVAAGDGRARLVSLVDDAEPGTILSQREVHRLFGSFPFVRGPGDSIVPDERWVRASIVDYRVPLLGWVRCHRNVVPQLYYAMTEIERAGLGDSIETYDGCYVPRFVRGDDQHLSAHAYGIAIDVNAAANPRGAQPTMDPRVVRVMKRWGFAWGGDFSNPDGHHFEFVRYPRG